MRTKKLAIFATHPIQYQVPIWRKLAEMPDLEVLVIYGTDMSVRGYKDEGFGVDVTWDTPLLEGYESTFLSRDPSIQRVDFWKPNARGIEQILKEFQPDVGLLVAYRSLFHLGAWRALRQSGVPIVMRHEASDVAHARSGLKAKFRDFLLSAFYARIDRFAYIGAEARHHLTRLGVNKALLHHAPYCVDSDFVSQQISQWGPRRDELRNDLGIKEADCAFVFSGKVIDKKDPLLIAQALERLADSEDPADREALERIHIVVAGDGVLKSEMETRLKGVIGERAHFQGFLNQSEMGRAYSVGDALILASKRGSGETWGLVVNEAMQWGLLAFVSDGVGCGLDLVDDSYCGKRFSTRDVKALSSYLKEYVLLDPSYRDFMRERVINKVRNFSLDHAAKGVLSALKSV